MMAIIALLPLALFGLFLLINVVIGLCTGLKKSLARLAAVIASAIIALITTFIACSPTSGLISSVCGIIEELFAASALEEILAVEALGLSVAYYISMLISPFFFTVVFIGLSIILSIVAAIVIRFIFRNKKPGALLNRLGGALTGLVCAILVTIFILTPVAGIVGLVTPVLEMEEVKEGLEEGGVELDTGAIKVFTATCSPMYNLLASKRFEGKRVYLKNELTAVITIVENLAELAVDATEYGDDQIAALDNMLNALNSSPLLKNTVAGVLSEATTKWMNGETFAEIEKPRIEPSLAPFIDAMLELLSTSTLDTIEQDLGTMKDVFTIMIRSDIFKYSGDFDQLLTQLNKSGAITAVLDVIGRNERMAGISDEITNFSIRVLASAVGIPDDDNERYDLLMTDIANALNSTSNKSGTSRVSAMKPKLETAFDRYGVEVSGDTLDKVCEGLIADLGSKIPVYGSDVKEFFAIYAVAEAQHAASGADTGYDMLATNKAPAIMFNSDGTISVGGVVLQNYTAESFRSSYAYRMGSRGVDLEGAATLYSAEAMESTLVTVEDLTSSMTKYGDCPDINAETKKVGQIITRSLEVFDEIDFNTVTATELMSRVGEILDMMQASRVFGKEMTSNMMIALLQSKHMIKPLGISVAESTDVANKINEMVAGGKFDYVHATGIIADAITVMESAGDNTNKTKEEKKEDSKKLLDNISKDSADMLGSLVTPSLVENYGVTSAKSDTVSSTVASLLDNMANYDNPNDVTGEQTEKEAEAVSTLLDFAIIASGSKGTLFNAGAGGKGSLDTTAEDFVKLVVESEVVSVTINDMVYRDGHTDNPFGAKLNSKDTAEAVAAIEQYYVNNGGGTELARTLEAVAIMLNVRVDLGN